MTKRRMKLRLLPCIFLITPFCFLAISQPSSGNQVCQLNFSTYPYQPMGGCTTKLQEKNWNGFPKTRCCQNVLLVLSHALALYALSNPQQQIFMNKDSWKTCNRPFSWIQPNVRITSCGLEDLYHEKGHCSAFVLSDINQQIIQQCSLFRSYSFDYACDNCTAAISSTLDGWNDDGSCSEKSTGLVAIIVAVIARNQNDTSGMDDLHRCLPALIKEKRNYIKISVGVAEAMLAVILALTGLSVIIMLIKYVTGKSKKEKKPVYQDVGAACSSLYRFSKVEIENAIRYGPEKKCLGRGSAGEVYKGMLPSGQLVAIKQIYKSNTSDSFSREIDGLSRVRHPHLVALFGCCVEDGEHYLVYEYCPNGNLAQHLLKKGSALTWDTRVKILRHCASALKYLHHHTDGCIVHRDIKLTNILLTHDMEPKLSDFGLARMLGMEQSKVFTDVRGTIGYMDPEYMSNAKLTCASDIYSFGIVMLQLLSGQRVISLDLEARDQLTTKAKDVNMRKRPLSDLQDPRMNGDVVNVDFESILQMAVLCVASSSTGRPTIDVVFEELDKVWKNTQLQKARSEKVFPSATPSKSQELLRV